MDDIFTGLTITFSWFLIEEYFLLDIDGWPFSQATITSSNMPGARAFSIRTCLQKWLRQTENDQTFDKSYFRIHTRVFCQVENQSFPYLVNSKLRRSKQSKSTNWLTSCSNQLLNNFFDSNLKPDFNSLQQNWLKWLQT